MGTANITLVSTHFATVPESIPGVTVGTSGGDHDSSVADPPGRPAHVLSLCYCAVDCNT